jgi:hypothetical protein
VNVRSATTFKPQSDVVIAAMEKFEVEMAAQSLRDTNGTQSLPSGSGAMPNLCKLATLEGMEPTIGLEPITCRSRIRCGEWLPTNPISFQ